MVAKLGLQLLWGDEEEQSLLPPGLRINCKLVLHKVFQRSRQIFIAQIVCPGSLKSKDAAIFDGQYCLLPLNLLNKKRIVL
ncbi:MAG: hypothetical protein WBI44_04670 [Syntrophaceticus sp.]